VTLGIRPADVALSANGEGLSATVDAVEPTGPAQTVRATLADGWPLTVVVPARPLLAAGMHARFRFAPHRLHVFGPDGRRFVAADPPVA
jgi:multiple sugar transport system ATP-binding protein